MTAAGVSCGPSGLAARYADLIVGFGANVQPGQIVAIDAQLGQEWLVRPIAEACYERGALFVDAVYFDPWVKRARLRRARTDTLGWVPPWYGERVLELGERRAARIGLWGPAHPEAMVDVDPVRAGMDLLPAVREVGAVIADRATNWTIAPCPSRGWARLVHPGLDRDEAWRALCEDVARICRLDERDAAAAWRTRAEELERVAAAVNASHYDALRFRGPGTDLEIGLLPTSTFVGSRTTTANGIPHMGNLPSEEIFTAPDPLRAEGVVRATRPLVLAGAIVEGLEIEFRNGSAVRIDASKGAEILRGYVATDDGAVRLGEVALVDRHGRVARAKRVFYDTLLDENAASHIALGRAYGTCVKERDLSRINRSDIHVDVMIGSPEVTVTGIDQAGREHPILEGGNWTVSDR
jgi:aminopeptidase